MQVDLYLLPAQPDFAPDAQALLQARELLKTVFHQQADRVEMHRSAERRPYGSASALDHLRCPDCDRSIDVWSDPMEPWWEGFQDLLFGAEAPMKERVKMPCCRMAVNIGRIDFQGRIRFARAALQVAEPEDAKPLDAARLQPLEDLLQCRLVQFVSRHT